MTVRRFPRSWIVVPAHDRQQVHEAAKSQADCVVLDLAEFPSGPWKAIARANFRIALEAARGDRKEVYAQVSSMSLPDDVAACAWHGLDGVVVSRVESAEGVVQADRLLSLLEQERGITARSLKIVAAIETAGGNLAAFEIARASPRLLGMTLGRADLIMDLRPEPTGEIHLMPYLMQRLVLIAGATNLVPIGAWWRSPDRGLAATPENTLSAALRGRAIGFQAAMCLSVSQVLPINSAYAADPAPLNS